VFGCARDGDRLTFGICRGCRPRAPARGIHEESERERAALDSCVKPSSSNGFETKAGRSPGPTKEAVEHVFRSRAWA
jgi:hypothetical protein